MDLHSIPAHSPEMASDEELRLLGEDLVRLCLNDPRTIFDSVCARYERKKRLYTRIGASDLLALNLHEHLSIFEPSVFAQFLPPKAPSDHSGAHIFATASQTLKDVSGDGKEAAIVFCGEAGAGKTTNFFNTLRFLAFIEERRRTEAEEGNNSSNPKVYRVNLLSVKAINALELILAAFGAAKTIKNDRSTLHAYAVELHYRGSALEGLSFLDPSLPVELSRIIGQRKGEGNFCVFYQLCGGIDATQREMLGLAGADKYFYLSQGGCCQEGVKTSAFAELVDALSLVGFSDHQKELIWRLLAAILHIGNLFFKPQSVGNEEDNVAEIVNETELRWVAVLLQTDFELLKRAFTHSDKDQRLNVESALDVRDAFAIILYGGLFRWILSRISMFFRPSSSREATTEYNGTALGKIILLDVPGSRRYNNNGYEEFCINLLNERLEHFFQQQRFGQFSDDQLQNVFASRGALSQYNWPCNERTMELLVKRPMGILPLLDDECKFPRGTEETFLQHCNINHLDNAIYAKARVKGRLEFGIRHHFGLSFYSIDGFLAKNRFQQPAFIFTILSCSKDTSMASVFGEMLSSKVEDRSVYVANEWHRGIVKLCEQLKSFRLHFVRCIRANIETPGGKMDQQLIQRQLRILTVSDHCLAVRDGFQHKIPIKKFANSFRALLPEEVVNGQNVHQIARDVLDAQGIRYAGNFEFVSGHVFLMEPLFERLCELKQATLNLAALIIQRNFRKFLARRYFLLKRAAATQIQAAFRGWKCRKRLKSVASLRERTINTLTERVREKAGEGQEQLLNMLINSGEQLQGELGALLQGMHSLCKQKDEQAKWTQFLDCSNYVPSTLAVKWKPFNAPTVPLEQFAADQIKAIPVGARREPIVAPFLAKETEEEFLQSLALFRLVLSYQYQPESSSSTDPCRLAVLAKAIVRHGILFPSLRDELFLQLINQTHKSICKMAMDRAWTLLLCAINAFPPTEAIVPLLHGIFQVQPPTLSKMLFAGCLKMRFRQIEPAAFYGSRHFGPSLLEYNAFVQRRPFTLLAHFVTGESLLIETDAWKTAEEMVQTMLRQRGIGDSFGWCLELDDGLRCTCIHSSLFLFDAITQIEENRQFFTEQFGTESPLFAFFDSPKSIGEEKFEKINNEKEIGKSLETVDSPPAKNAAASQIGRKHLLSNDFYRPKFAQSSKMERPLHQQPSAVRTRLDEGVQLRRSSNTNCMSRITEREEDGTSTNGEGTLGLIRDVPVPTSDGAVERFLDDVFEKALPPVDYDLEDKDNTDEAENEIPSKASTPWESIRRKLNGQCPTTQNANFIWPKRFVYRTGGGIFVERNEQEVKDVPETYEKQQQFKTYQPNGEFTSTEQQMENCGENLLGQPTATMLRGMADVAFGVQAPLRHLQTEEGRYEEVFNRKWGQYVPMKQYFDNKVKTEEEEEEEEEEATESDTDDGLISETHSEEEAEAVCGAPGNEWVPESEFALDILLFNTRPQAQQPSGTFSVVGENQPIPRQIVNFNNENSPKKAAKSVSALTYSQQPFRLILCRDLFVPGEVLDDALEIDLTFAQIIRDCRRQLCQPRIRRYEREAVQQLLRSFNIPPNALNKPSTIPTNVKLELIGIVRKWPLYFCRLFPVVEERPSGRFPQLLGISETGIRLVSVLSNQNGNGKEVNMAIQDHFDWCDIAELVLENDACALRIVTRQNIAILISGQQMARVKQLIESLVVDGTKRRHFVVAVSAYSTRESNVLSFESGDCIQLIDRPDSEMPSTGGQWLFGRMARASRGTKLDGRFGWFPAEYVLSNAEVGEQQRENSSDGGGDGPTTSNPFTTIDDSFRECVGSEYPFSMAIPQSLEPLFANIDPQLLFVPNHAGADRFTFLEFAYHFFRRPKGNGAKFSRSAVGDWPCWKELADRIKFSDRPIAHSLLRLESHEADRVAQQSFLVIMRFMGDETLKRHQSFTDCVYELLSLCHVYVPIRDEIYCQILKQVTENRSEKCGESTLRGWRLLSILCAYYECSETFKPFLVKFIGEFAFNARRTFSEIAKISLYNLAQTFRFGGRRLILSAAEVEAIANGKNVRRQLYHLPGGHRRLINTRPVTVAEEIVRALCLEMNIRSVAEQQEFSLCYILHKDNSVHTLLNDEYVLDVCTELETRGDDYLLILTRSVWLHPVRRESDLCTDALFFQLLPNYLAGLPVSLRQDGSATAAALDDMTTLGALLVLSGHRSNPKMCDLLDLIPKNVLNNSNISHERWLQRVYARVKKLNGLDSVCSTTLKARQHFLEIIERWPLFGAAFYFVRRVYSGKNLANSVSDAAVLAENCVLAVNKFGLRVLSSGTHHILAEFALDEIHEMTKYSVSDMNFFEIRFAPWGKTENQHNAVTVETDLGNEISRLIGHYIFLNNGAAKLC